MRGCSHVLRRLLIGCYIPCGGGRNKGRKGWRKKWEEIDGEDSKEKTKGEDGVAEVRWHE